MPRTNQRTLLDDLVAAGRLESTDAEAIAAAPRFSLPIREIVSYLAGLIVLVGIIRLIAAALEDASKITIAAVLYVVAVLSGAAAWRLRRRRGAWGRFAEVLEIATLGSGGLAIGLTLSNVDLRDEWAAIIPSAAVAAWGIVRLRSSQFVSAVMVPIAVMVVAGQISSLVDWHEELDSIPIMIGGAVLIGLGVLRPHLAFLMRGVGAIAILGSCVALASQRDGLDGLLPGLLLGVAIFSLGAVRMWIDLILPGGALVVLAVSIFIFRHVDNSVLQGVLVILVGLVVLAVTTVVVRRSRRQRPTSAVQSSKV